MKVKKEKEIVNGYTIPGGAGGYAVKLACHIILNEPGIRQVDLLDRLIDASGLNASTAGWLISVREGSPGAYLWRREKNSKGHYCIYPNDFTSKVSSHENIIEEMIEASIETLKTKNIDTSGTLCKTVSSMLLHAGTFVMISGFCVGYRNQRNESLTKHIKELSDFNNSNIN